MGTSPNNASTFFANYVGGGKGSFISSTSSLGSVNNTANNWFESPLFEEGFGSFLKSGEFSDLTIASEGKIYYLHRVILAHSSKVFADFFDDNAPAQPDTLSSDDPSATTSTTQQTRIVRVAPNSYELRGPFIEHFDTVIAYMYDGKVDLTQQNALPILSLSNTFHIKGLKKYATFYLTSKITKENAFAWLNKAIQIGSDDLATKCITVICKHFNQIIQPSVASMFSDLLVVDDDHAIVSTAPDVSVTTADHILNSSANSDSDDNSDDASPGHPYAPAHESPTTSIPITINNINNNNNNSTYGKFGSPSPSPSSSFLTSNDKSLSISTIHAIPELLALPVGMMIRLMRQNNLSVSNEAIVYKTVVKYIQANRATLSEADIVSLFECVRLPLFNYAQLEEAQENTLIPKHLVTEALLLRLKMHEGPKEPNKQPQAVLAPPPPDPELDSLAQMRRTPRAAYAISLEYNSLFDACGVFYYIGTNGYKEDWSNPAHRGRVRVTCSSTEKGNVTECVGRTPTECWSMDVPASWLAINLGSSRTMVPTFYTLRHGGNSKADCLRNWTLQGSMDSKLNITKTNGRPLLKLSFLNLDKIGNLKIPKSERDPSVGPRL
eukprot:gene5727-6624_t